MGRTCKKCGSTDFRPSDKKGTLRCASCRRMRAKKRRDRDPSVREKERASRRRQRLEDVPAVILVDSRSWDKKQGLENDLTAEWIASRIAHGCTYCGETQIRMTLDRVDNNIGHTRGNCVAACVRCNYVRRTMPHEAWTVVARGMRDARERGLFGEWIGIARLVARSD